MTELDGEVDPFDGLDHELPPPSSPPPSSPPEKASMPSPRRGRRPRSAPPQRPTWPKWFADRRRQEIAEFLAFSMWVDDCLGLPFAPERWPYSEYKREGVEKFRAMVKVEPMGVA